jgi:hypothetical protein
MFVAGGFRAITRHRAIKCVLDHGAPEQGRGQRVLSFDQLWRRIDPLRWTPIVRQPEPSFKV